MNCGGDNTKGTNNKGIFFGQRGRGRVKFNLLLNPPPPTHGYDAGNTQYNTLNYTSDGVLNLCFYKIQ